MRLSIQTREVGGIYVVDITGRITGGEECDALRAHVKNLLASNKKKILLNMEKVSYIDSSALSSLMSVYTAANSQDGSLKVVNLNKISREVWETTRLFTLIETFGDEGTALASFRPKLKQLFADSHEKAAEEVIAVTKAQWAAEMKNDVATAMNNVADDYTEFNPDYPTRLDGKELSVTLAEAFSEGSGSLVAAEMANPKVQVYGDIAVLSYNFIGAAKNKDGEVESIKAKSTRVYVKKDGDWWLVHANFAPAD